LKLLLNCLAAVALMAVTLTPARAQSSLFSDPPPELTFQRSGPRQTGDVVVRFRSDVSRERCNQLITSLGCQVADVDPGSGYTLVRVRDGRATDLLGVLANRPEVVLAEPSYWLHTYAQSLYDPYQWNLFERGTPSARAISEFGIQAAPAWSLSRGEGVTVAVIDSGVAYEDYDDYYQAPALLQTRFSPGYDFVNRDEHPNDDVGHGTYVTGILASRFVDGGGVTGVAPEITVMPLKAMRADGLGSDYNIARAIRWAADEGASVINLSLGGEGAGQVLADAVRYAASKDCVLVAAAGNENAAEVGYPAYYSDCISVGSTNFDGTRASYSNRGRRLELMAPGGNTRQDLNGDGRPDGIVAQTFEPDRGFDSFNYMWRAGTSFSAPQVAGVAALIRSVNPALSALEVRLAMREHTLHLGAEGRNSYYGYGLVDALAAVKAALPQE
jgi:serine protease